MAESDCEEIRHTAPPSSTLPVRYVKPESEKSSTVDLGVASNYEAIEKLETQARSTLALDAHVLGLIFGQMLVRRRSVVLLGRLVLVF